MDAQGATSLSDALRNVPGITIGAAEGGQIGNNINLRGFTARTDIYLDGFRDRGQYYRDTFDLEAIEVLKGPSSMLFGRGSTGGVINQVSKKADAASRRPKCPRRSARDDRYRTTVDVNQPTDRYRRDPHERVRPGPRLDARRDEEQGLRHCADGALRHRHADRRSRCRR